MKFTAAMTISRCNAFVQASVNSITSQTPDEFIVYLEHDLLDNDYIRDMLDACDAIVKPMLTGYATKRTHHMVNVAVSTYCAIHDAKYEWVRWCDDDDQWLLDTRYILSNYAEDHIGIIHGDVRFLDGIRKGAQIESPTDTARKFIGSGNIINRDAFRVVSRAAIMSAHLCEASFLDWRIAYWILQTRRRSIYIPEVFCTQGLDISSLMRTDEYFISRRYRWADKWEEVVSALEKGEYKRYFNHKEDPFTT